MWNDTEGRIVRVGSRGINVAGAQLDLRSSRGVWHDTPGREYRRRNREMPHHAPRRMPVSTATTRRVVTHWRRLFPDFRCHPPARRHTEGAGRIGAAVGADADATASPVLDTYVGPGSNLQAGDVVSLTARAFNKAYADANAEA